MAKSPRKQTSEVFEADPDAKEKARKAQENRSKKKQSLLDKYSYHIVISIFVIVMGITLINSLWKNKVDISVVEVNDEAYFTLLNSQDRTYKVGAVSMFKDYKLADAKAIINAQASNKNQLFRCASSNKDAILSESYDFREAYPQCVRPIAEQGNCSSSYSIATVSAVNDRWCRTHGAQSPILSAQTTVACDKFINSHCKGGFVTRVLDFAKLYGLVSEECLPYNSNIQSPEECQKKTANCEKFKVADYCLSSETQKIKQEIFNFGPVIVVIPVYRDFLVYKGGLYQVYPNSAKFPSGHAVKLIGWTVKEQKECWLVENSWGTDWGQDGIAYTMDIDELQIERMAFAISLKQAELDEERVQQQFDNSFADQTQEL